MIQSQASDSPTRALSEKPSLALMAKEDGHVWTGGCRPDPPTEGRIRDAAYALYEARGHAHGHDVDDWLAAEAALADEPSRAESRAVPSTD
jgi:Protein of unknown function (DUF2934)